MAAKYFCKAYNGITHSAGSGLRSVPDRGNHCFYPLNIWKYVSYFSKSVAANGVQILKITFQNFEHVLV